MDETVSERFGPETPEGAAAAALGRRLGVTLRSRRLTQQGGTSVEIEGMDDDGRVIAQFVLNGGAIRSSLRNKVAADMFKLIWVRTSLATGATAVLCVSTTVATILARRGWLGTAARDLGVDVYVLGDAGTVEQLPL